MNNLASSITVQSPAGDVITVTAPQPVAQPATSAGFDLAFSYDSSSRLTRVERTDGRITVLTYDSSGSLGTITVTEPNGTSVSRTLGYDTSSRLVSLVQ